MEGAWQGPVCGASDLTLHKVIKYDELFRVIFPILVRWAQLHFMTNNNIRLFRGVKRVLFN